MIMVTTDTIATGTAITGMAIHTVMPRTDGSSCAQP